MKKIIAVILTVALLSCAFIIPVSATNSEEYDNRLYYQTFLEKYLRGSDEYLLCYEELYYSKNTNDELEWVFIHARIDGGDSDEYYDDEFCGVHVLQTSGYVPFEFGYGVYDVKENKFYDLTEVSYYNKTHDTPKYEYAFDLFKTYYKPEKIGDQNENVFSIVGSSTAIFGTAYNLNDESTVMTFDPDDGLYKYTFSDVQPEKNVTFAVVMNHKWYDEYPVFNEETINIISSGDILVTFDAKTTKIELSGDGIQTAIDVENAIAVGNGSENFMNNEYWNPTAEINSMKEVSDGVWEYTCANVPAGEDYQIKACFNSIGNENPYEYNFGAVDDNKVELGAELTASFNGRPCHFDVAEDGSTVTYRLDISNFNFYTKQGAKFSITVTPPEDVYTVQVVNTGFYPYPEEIPMTYNENSGLYELASENVEPQNTYIYVWKNHTEKYGDPDAGNGYPYEINVVETCDVLITFDPETGIINAVGDGVMPPLDLYIDSVIVAGNGEGNYLNGANWDPADTSNSMTEVEDGIWELTMENIDAYDNYNFKFAVNSVDENGNPTTDPWRYSFGAEFEQFYPTGVVFDAVYGGKNIIFEAEEDSYTVIIRLDLRDFDFQTKKGAKFSVTIPTTEGNQYEYAFKNWSVTKYGEGCLDDGYSYNELYTHYSGGEPDWVLVEARYNCPEPEMVTHTNLGGAGGRAIFGPSIGIPFFTHYGVYDVNANEFYGFEQFADNDCSVYNPVKRLPFDHTKYDGLIETLAELKIGSLLGDINNDNEVDILDATLIQKAAAGKAHIDFEDSYIADVNGDYSVDILDATAIQKYAVSA